VVGISVVVVPRVTDIVVVSMVAPLQAVQAMSSARIDRRPFKVSSPELKFPVHLGHGNAV
jgi:hypothetical protein